MQRRRPGLETSACLHGQASARDICWTPRVAWRLRSLLRMWRVRVRQQFCCHMARGVFGEAMRASRVDGVLQAWPRCIGDASVGSHRFRYQFSDSDHVIQSQWGSTWQSGLATSSVSCGAMVQRSFPCGMHVSGGVRCSPVLLCKNVLHLMRRVACNVPSVSASMNASMNDSFITSAR